MKPLTRKKKTNNFIFASLGTLEPGRLQSMGSRRVGHDWATSLSLFTFMHWRRKWQPTPVFLPGESQGPGSLVGCRLWGRTESDTTEATSLHFTGTLDSYFPSLKKKKKEVRYNTFSHLIQTEQTVFPYFTHECSRNTWIDKCLSGSLQFPLHTSDS